MLMNNIKIKYLQGICQGSEKMNEKVLINNKEYTFVKDYRDD